MASKFKALGLAFVAITAMSAVAASAAQAGTLHIGTQQAVVTAHIEAGQQHVLTIPDEPFPFTAVCDEATLEATVQQPQATQTIHDLSATPTYNKCKLAGQASTVKMNGCYYTLTGAGQAPNTSLVDIVGCTPGKQIQIITPICTVDVPAQNGLSHIVGTNLNDANPNTSVRVTATVKNITAVQTGAACPSGNNAHTTEAAFAGKTIAQAFVDLGNQQVTKHEHQRLTYKCGAMVHLIST